MKKAVKECKVKNLKEKIDQLEKDYRDNNSHNLFKTVWSLESKSSKSLNTIKDKNGILKTDLREVLVYWKDHFENHLNNAFPHDEEAIETIPQPTDSQVADEIITIDEIKSAVKWCKVRKAPGIDLISAEAVRSGGEAMVGMLHKMFQKI